MDTLGSIMGVIFDVLIAIFGWMGAGGSLFALSMLLGVGMLLAFKWIGEPQNLDISIAKMQAHMMEMRLFDREPKLVFTAMGKLFWWNGKLFMVLLKPALVVTPPDDPPCSSRWITITGCAR